jgi:integrase
MSARPFSEDEYHRIVCSLAASGLVRDRLLVVFGCATGFRISEILSLKAGQVFDGSNVLREVRVPRRNLKGGKGRKARAVRERRVPLASVVQSVLADFLAATPNLTMDAPLFGTGRSGCQGMNRSQAFRILRAAAERAGVSVNRVSTHSLRKTFARRVFEGSKNDLLKTQRIMGHSSPVITARYLESDDQELDQLVRSVAA